MKQPLELVVDREPAPDDVQYLEDRIYEFNSAATGIADGEPVGNRPRGLQVRAPRVLLEAPVLGGRRAHRPVG